jgi:predicted RNA polymerase sigma factor
MTMPGTLELERPVFDTAETRILSAAFEKAWAFVEFDPMLGDLELAKRQSQLARSLMKLLKLGETNPTSLANTAIMILRKNRKANRRRPSGDQQRSSLVDRQLLLRYR